LFLALSLGHWARPMAVSPSTPHGDEARRVAALYAGWDFEDAPGLAIMVIHRGDIRYEAGYGLADVHERTPIGPSTLFRIASLTKPFTAMAIMILAEAGKLDYDDPITRFLPELPGSYQKVSIRHLLTHTGGIPDYYAEVYSRFRDRLPTNRDALGVLKGSDGPRFEPGERYEYSNAGYELLALIIERAAGEPYGDFLRRRIFEPLGMKDTRVAGRSRVGVENCARGYRAWVWGSEPELFEADPLNALVGAGGIYSTLEDLYRWDQALYGEKLVSRHTLEQALRPAVAADGARLPAGYGWLVGSYHGQKLVYQTGRWLGFRSAMFRLPGAEFTAIILANHARLPVEATAWSILEIYGDRLRKAR
jgi:CubicO group peptidase (beta-lactamase class C family)